MGHCSSDGELQPPQIGKSEGRVRVAMGAKIRQRPGKEGSTFPSSQADCVNCVSETQSYRLERLEEPRFKCELWPLQATQNGTSELIKPALKMRMFAQER